MHLVFRVTDTPLRVLDDLTGRAAPREVGCVVVGGARSAFYLRDVSVPVCSVEVQFRPGAVPLLFGAGADALAERHTRLEDLWGREASEVRSRIAEAGSLEAQVAVLEAVLASRLPTVRGLHPAVAEALEHFAHHADVDPVLARSGFSQRHFIRLFRGAVGLGPKTFARVRRFQRALGCFGPGASLAQVALASGYADQSHFNREFLALAGITPAEYVRAAPGAGNHVATQVAMASSIRAFANSTEQRNRRDRG